MTNGKARILILMSILFFLLEAEVVTVGAAQRCEDWVARITSVQGTVQVQKAGRTQWAPVELDDTYCMGDTIRVREQSRAAVVLRNEAVIRLDQNTTISFSGVDREENFLLNLFSGGAHFFSRTPRHIKVITPFVNAAVGGTEFVIRVDEGRASVSVLEGHVSAVNEAGSLSLGKGQAAVALPGRAPELHVVVRPRDAVQWALYYPPILDYRASDFAGGGESGWQAQVRRSLESYRDGNLAEAFSSLLGVVEPVPDPRFYIYRAGLLLTVGQVEDANEDIERAFALDAANSQACALKSVVALAQNRKDDTMQLAKRAVELDPASSTARVALSYAQQAWFDLKGASASLEEAVRISPDNALAWARLAELRLSTGYLNKALDAAEQAVTLNPKLARTQTILGFAYLTQIKTRESKAAFEKAIRLDQADPLPRLGLGLAKIREGELKAGRMEIEIAVGLDPNNSLIRSYLGKAFYEEKREKQARVQFSIAKELDPMDPTPWYYDAILKQSVNRPVEALKDLQKSIELNDNRAVYRSRLLLDQDQAAREASLARVYNDLGFTGVAFTEGLKSLNADPANYSAHRLLADMYSFLPNRENSRVSEVLQSQLLQPISIMPVPPKLAQNKLFILEGTGPGGASFNEYNPLFTSNRLALNAGGVAGGRGIVGDEVVQSGVWNRLSYSLGQFHYQTDGFRKNNDLTDDIRNVYVQYSLSSQTNLMGEYRRSQNENGDLQLRFDPTNFTPTQRQEKGAESFRLGFHQSFAPSSDLIGTVIHQHTRDVVNVFPDFLSFDSKEDGYMGEAQYIFRSEFFHVVTGVGQYMADRTDHDINFGSPETTPVDINNTDFYLYTLIRYPQGFTWTLGGSFDRLLEATGDTQQLNPKLGVSWNILPETVLRAAAFRTLERTLVSGQTLEPTQVAGFSQYFSDTPQRTSSWHYGIGLDQRFSETLFGGLEYSGRQMEVPFVAQDGEKVLQADWNERVARAYLYWAPKAWLALTTEYQYQVLERQRDSNGDEGIIEARTHQIPFGAAFYHPSGFFLKTTLTYVHQSGTFSGASTSSGEDQFCVVDAYIGYRLPKRWGVLSLGAKNLFDKRFHFQDPDPRTPTMTPERLLVFWYTLSY